MKKIILGIIVGGIIFIAFLSYGGAEYVKNFGKKTVEVGKTLEGYEKELQRQKKLGTKKAAAVTRGVKDAYEKTKDKAGRSVEWTKESAQNIAGKTRDGADKTVRWTKDEVGRSIDGAKKTMVGGGNKDKD